MDDTKLTGYIGQKLIIEPILEIADEFFYDAGGAYGSLLSKINGIFE